jgi:general nucleoside transport system permease protein
MPSLVENRGEPGFRPAFSLLRLELRQHMPAWQQAAILGAGLIFGILMGAGILVLFGVSAAELVQEFGAVIFSSTRALSAVLVQAAPLLIAGLGAAVAFKVRFWNIGIEGQMILGSIFATWVATENVGPAGLRLALMLAAAALGGALWIVAPALLKLRLGVNELISTLLLNYVALNLLLHLLYGSWRDPVSSFPHSEQYGSAERLPLLGWESLSLVLPLALALALLCWWLMNVSRAGFFMRFVSANPNMARAIGIPLGAVTLGAALLSGALAGTAGFAISSGIEYRMTQSFFVGYGFSGILIAFLSRNNPLAAVLVSIFVAVLFVAGQSLQVFYQIPGAMVQLIQAIIVLSVAGSDFFIRHRIRRVG